ncbi:hypothetical protein [Brevundimonas goettingensis]|uniref:Uncharacterized protein n=1 Tax=Brevundimonas goettingensis TaxID=2774190 RepID=A0A975C6X0_9CAUL|nr:hypothetical protein [Brevundimonas goettingensis]QTC92692.1 hypothetical protein IFJ75_07475 [Brevundimonas goettingensis]
MTDNAPNTSRSSGGGNAGLAFIVGGLLVVVAVIAWFVFAGGGLNPAKKEIDVDVNLPKVEAPKLPDAPSPQAN